MAPKKQRVVLAILSFIGFVIVYLLRVNLSVAMVAMVNATAVSSRSNHSAAECPPDRSGNNTVTDKTGEFDWDEQTQGLILGSFFWGYVITQVPGGMLAESVGAKWVLGLGILWTSVFTLLTPLAARWSVLAFIGLRVLEGIGEGVTFPALNAMLSQWSPPLERTMMSVFIISGSHMGTVIGLPLSGYMCSTEFLGGWPSVFYVFGIAGIVWFVFWCILVYSSPGSHPWISREERDFIQSSLRQQISADKQQSSGRRRLVTKLPVKAMLTSPAVLSMVVMHMSFNWLFYMLLTCLPTFLSEVLNTPLTEDGLVSALPYLALCLAANAAAVAADAVRRRGWLGTTGLRKLAIGFGSVSGVVGIAVVGNLGCSRGLAVAVLTVSVGLAGVIVSGLGPNQLDLAPQFAGTLLGFSNTMATIPGMVAPVVVGSFTNHAGTRANWLKVFYLTAGINAFGCLCYLAFASGKVQPWAIEAVADDGEQQSDGEDEAEEETRRLLGAEEEKNRLDRDGHVQTGDRL